MARRVLFAAACIVCLLALTLTLPAADPRLDAPGTEGDGPQGGWAPVTGASEPAEDDTGRSGETGTPGDAGLEPGGGDQRGDDPPRIEVNGSVVPGTTVRVVPRNVDPRADTVALDGTIVGDGSTTLTVPYASEMTVSLPEASVERTVGVETNATIELDGVVAQNTPVQATVTVGGEAVPGLTVRRDGERVGTTNEDGRVPEPLLSAEEMETGTFQLLFEVGEYYRGGPSESTFLETVPVRFVIDEPDEHYHVPLLLSPGGYTTYRGS